MPLNIRLILAGDKTSRLHWPAFKYYLRKDFPQVTVYILSPGNPLTLADLFNSQYLVYENMPRPEGTTYNDTLSEK